MRHRGGGTKETVQGFWLKYICIFSGMKWHLNLWHVKLAPLRDKWIIFDLQRKESWSPFACCFCSFLQKDVHVILTGHGRLSVCRCESGGTFAWPPGLCPTLRLKTAGTTPWAQDQEADGWISLFLLHLLWNSPDSSAAVRREQQLRAPPRDCNWRNVMSAYTGTLHCINRRLAGGGGVYSENGGHKSSPPSRLLKPSAKFHFEPVKQTGSITER